MSESRRGKVGAARLRTEALSTGKRAPSLQSPPIDPASRLSLSVQSAASAISSPSASSCQNSPKARDRMPRCALPHAPSSTFFLEDTPHITTSGGSDRAVSRDDPHGSLSAGPEAPDDKRGAPPGCKSRLHGRGGELH